MILVHLIYGFLHHNANYHPDVYFITDIIQVNLPLINQMVPHSLLNTDQVELKDFGLMIMLILLESMYQMFNSVRLLVNRELHLSLQNLMEFQVWLGLKLPNVNALLYSKLFGLKV
jgi:hypothetical protein